MVDLSKLVRVEGYAGHWSAILTGKAKITHPNQFVQRLRTISPRFGAVYLDDLFHEPTAGVNGLAYREEGLFIPKDGLIQLSGCFSVQVPSQYTHPNEYFQFRAGVTDGKGHLNEEQMKKEIGPALYDRFCLKIMGIYGCSSDLEQLP
jgi:hypothetical protein